jgi:hypothetical protein
MDAKLAPGEGPVPSDPLEVPFSTWAIWIY